MVQPQYDIVVVLLELQLTIEDLLRKNKELESEAALSNNLTKLPADPEFSRLVLKELFLPSDMPSLHDANNGSKVAKRTGHVPKQSRRNGVCKAKGRTRRIAEAVL